MPLPDDPTRTAAPATTGSFAGSPTAGERPPLPANGGRYILGEEIAHGGMGVVYQATDTVLGREVAVKVLLDKYASASAIARRFTDEARIAAQLQHPNIPPVHDLGTLPDGQPFLAMKLIKGQTLEELLRNRTDRADDHGRFVAAFEQVCQAVAYAHAHRVVHRDLKPSNVMVGKYGDVQVMDWGLSKVLGSRPTESDNAKSENPGTEVKTLRESDGSETQAGSILGTPGYMPPEQAIGAIAQIDERSDVFGLGAVLAVILTGKPPFVGDTAETTRILAAQGKVDECFARLDVSGADPELIQLCKCCLAADASNRPANAGVVALAVAELRQAADGRARLAEIDKVRVEGEKAAAEVKAAESRKRRRVQFVLVAAMVLLLVVAGFGAGLARLWQDARVARDGEKEARTAAEDSQRATEDSRDELAQAREQLARIEYGRTMNVAYQEVQDSNISAAITLLAGTRPEWRGWEYQYVHRLCHSHLLALKHEKGLGSAAYSPDGSRIVTACSDHTAQVWDARTGEHLLILRGHGEFVWSAAYSPDGSRIVTASYDRTAKVWNAETGAEIMTLRGHGQEVSSVAYSPDSARIVTGSYDLTAKLWDANTGKEITTLKGHSRAVLSAAFSPDGDSVLTASRDNTARIWITKTGVVARTLKGHTDVVCDASYSRDGTRIVTAGADGTAKVWDARTGTATATFTGHRSVVTSASFHPDGQRVVSGGLDCTARVWRADDGTELTRFAGHTGTVFGATFSPDGLRVLTAGWDRTAKIWDAATGAEPRPLTPPRVATDYAILGAVEHSAAPALNPDGRRMAASRADRTAVVVWNPSGGEEQRVLNCKPAYVRRLVWDRDGTRLAIVCSDNSLRVWDAIAGTPLRKFDLGDTGSISAAFSPDGARIATAGTMQPVAIIWDVSTGASLRTLAGHAGTIHSVCWSTDGTRLATGGGSELSARSYNGVVGSFDHEIKIWDAGEGAEIRTLRGHGLDVQSVAFSADGSRLVSASHDKTAKIWDASNGADLLTLRGHTNTVMSAAFSPDGSRIVTGGADRLVKIWSAATGDELLTLKGHRYLVATASFSRDGWQIIAASDEVKIWDARPVSRELLGKGLMPKK